MKFHLQKECRQQQNALLRAIRSGVPLAGLLAALPLAGGCGDTLNPPTLAGEIPAPQEENCPPVRGDIAEPPLPPGGMIQLPATEESTEFYTVRPGDTLSKIARARRVPLAALKRLNGFSDAQADRLRPGQQIVIPKSDNRPNEKDTPPATAGKIRLADPEP